VLTYFVGPILAFFPRRWRESLPAALSVQWRPATILSGLAESVMALIAMVYWYSHSVTTWVSHGLDSALSGKMGPQVTDQEIGFVAILIFALHPLTWAIAYCGVEGMVRLAGAAFTDNIFGVLPLYLVDKAIVKISGRGQTEAKSETYSTRENLASYAGAIREKVLMAGLPKVPDELCFTRSEVDEILEIRACRKKEDWTPPRVMRYQDAYYRLETSSQGAAPRPFVYVLRRLAAGVPGRSVLLYRPEEVVISGKQ
jgi:hypothetical protein